MYTVEGYRGWERRENWNGRLEGGPMRTLVVDVVKNLLPQIASSSLFSELNSLSGLETWGWIKIGLINCFCYRVFRALLIHARVM